jgi:cohesin complex subunit SCC1
VSCIGSAYWSNAFLLFIVQQIRQSPSNLNESKDLSGLAPPDGKESEEPDDDFNVPFADDSEDEQAPASGVPKLDDSTLQLSQEGGTTGSANNTSNLSGLDDSPSSKRSREEEVKPRKKRRKRRKVVIDNHKTELSNEHIRNMLNDTSDIVRKMVHPASWEGEDSNSSFTLKHHGEKVVPPILTQPFLVDEGDDGGPRLHPRLRKLWEDNYWRALGNPCPYRTKVIQEEDDHDDDDDSVEQVRRDQKVDEEADDQSDLEVPIPDSNVPQNDEPEDFDMPQMDDEEEDEPADAPAVDLDDDDDEELVEDGEEDDLNLGLVNDMAVDSDEEGEDRQTLGDIPESTTKWHKHTVRVFKHLKKCMRDPSAAPIGDDEEAQDLPEQVQFFDIIKKVKTRRNAASVFFEILQLKTWDFIEVDQDEPFGDITISPSVRFGEDPPN